MWPWNLSKIVWRHARNFFLFSYPLIADVSILRLTTLIESGLCWLAVCTNLSRTLVAQLAGLLSLDCSKIWTIRNPNKTLCNCWRKYLLILFNENLISLTQSIYIAGLNKFLTFKFRTNRRQKFEQSSIQYNQGATTTLRTMPSFANIGLLAFKCSLLEKLSNPWLKRNLFSTLAKAWLECSG